MNTSPPASPPNADPGPGSPPRDDDLPPSPNTSPNTGPNAGPNAGDPTSTGPRVSSGEVRDLGRMRRTVGPDRKVAGVAAGLARHLDIDPVITRVALVVLVFFGGIGLVFYLVCWLLMPEDGTDRALLNLDPAARSLTLKIVGALSVVSLLATSLGSWSLSAPVIVAAGVLLIVFWVVEHGRRRSVVTAPPVPHHVDPVTGQLVPAQVPVQMPDQMPGQLPGPFGHPTTTDLRYPARVPTRPRRGPILFWFTLALAVLGCGSLAIAAGAGAAIPGTAYPALVLGLSGVMLLVGSFWGRAGGLIPLGLVAALAVLVAAVVGPWHGSGDLNATPSTAADLRSTYQITAGSIVLDLTEVDPQTLVGRTVHLDARAGRITVLVPADLPVRATGQVRWTGQATVFDGYVASSGGSSITRVRRPDSAPSADSPPSSGAATALTVVATVGAGEVVVRTDGTTR